MTTRILIECTRTARTQLYTGIQRFVRRTIQHALELSSQQDAFEVLPVIIEQDAFVGVQNLPPHPHENRRGNRHLALSGPLTLGPDDQLLMIDAAWHLDAWPALHAARRQGTRLNFVWHDLIPLHYPSLFDAPVSQRFKAYLKEVIAHADRIVAVSQTVQTQLMAHIDRVAPERRAALQISWNHPGADILDRDQAAAVSSVRPALHRMAAATTESPLLLAVSTLEPRKNYALLLRACEAAWAAGDPVRLCIVGHPGWKVDALLDTLNRHPERNKRLFVWHDLTDVELDFCYQRADCLIYPSTIEGFGLPIAEAGWHRLPVIVSDTEIHREVAGPQATYFKLSDPNSLRDMIVQIARQQTVAETGWPEAGRFHSWQVATQRLLAQLLQPVSYFDQGVATRCLALSR